MSIQEMKDLKQHYLKEMLSLSNDLGIKDYRNEKIDIHFRWKCEDKIDELRGENYSLGDIISQLPPFIVITTSPPVLPTFEDPEDFIIMGNEDLSTIPKKELDKFINSSVEELDPIPSESEDTSGSENKCDMPVCDDSSSKNEGLDDITSIPTGKEINHLDAILDSVQSFLNRANSIIFLIEEFVGELAPINPIPPGIVEADFHLEEDIRLNEKLLNNDSSPRPPKELNYEIHDAIIESFSPSPIPFDFYNVPSSPRPPKKPLDDDVYFDVEPDIGILTTKVMDDISNNSTRELYVHVPNVLPTLTTLYPVFDTLLPFSSENEDKLFNLEILTSKEEQSPHLLSHRGFKVFQLINDSKSPMMIYEGDIPILDVPYLHLYLP
uniref:Reverse transcriptase domain-containing protein n=1 Tax=Tanacetum cinerariifolium TaxID=118510 RepID=A0A699KEZ3_TANCI|nr:hypothetical protein [Tanacetum cinerariifolium]